MDLIGAKVIVLILLGLVKLGSGLAPLLLVRFVKRGGMKWIENFMAGLMCFGGGVLLATVFIHMLPEVRESLETSRIDKGGNPSDHSGYPFGELVLCGGFFTIYFIEALVHKIFNIHNHSHGIPMEAETIEIALESDVEQNSSKDEGEMQQGQTNLSYSLDIVSSKDSIKNESMSTIQLTPSENNNEPVVDVKAKEKSILSAIRSFVIVLALSIHAIFEGMAIGLQLNEEDVWKLFIAVAIHECAILFCVGNEMVSNGIKRCQMVTYMITLAAVTPIGMIIGIILTIHVDAQSGSQILIVGLLQGLAGGTLLYVTFFEVLEREKLDKIGMTGLMGCFLIILGFGLMSGLEAAGGHDHGLSHNATLIHNNISIID